MKYYRIVKSKLMPFCIKVFLIQTVIVLIVLFIIDYASPIAKSELISVNIVISDIHYSSRSRAGNRLYIWDNGQKYIFTPGAFSDYSCKELYDALSIGDKLNISYYEHFLSQNIIFEAKSNETIYRTYENYRKGEKLAIPLTIPLIIFVEGIFALIVYVEFDTNRDKFFKRKKKKGKTVEGSVSCKK